MKIIKLFLIVLFILIFDQFFKQYAFFNPQLKYYLNTGISFSFLPTLPWRSILPIFVFILLGVLFKKSSYGLALLIGGGISNLIDRIVRGGVVDFIDLKIIPVFNMADLFISLGSIILLIEIIKGELDDDTQKDENDIIDASID